MDIFLQSITEGGDYVLLGNDIQGSSELYNQIFLALFGGNREQSTKREYAIGESRFDWWANALLFPENDVRQYNSLTERTLVNVSLTSAGRQEVEEAVKVDLTYLQALGKTEVLVYLISSNKIQIDVSITEPSGEQKQEYSFVWDSARNEIINS